MSPSLSQQISASIEAAESQLRSLRAQAQPNHRAIASAERELQVLERKKNALVEEQPAMAGV